MTESTWSIEQASAWLERRSAALLVGAEGLAPGAVALRARLTASDLPEVPNEARAELEALAAAPPTPTARAAAALLAAHRQAGAVDLGGDGQWAKAGAHPLVELVGSLGRGRCPRCPPPRFGAARSGPAPLAGAACPACGGPLRPDAVLGDEVVDPRRRLEAEYLAARADGVLVIGAERPSHALERVLRAPREEGASVVWVGESAPAGAGAWLRGAPDHTLPALARAFSA
jgi:NAD-dependent SIR2 family protein deacetylase